ncbi:hypothetical protein ACVGOW_07145 [Pseudonocardia saturnea]
MVTGAGAAFAISSDAMGFLRTTWHDAFGFDEALRYPGEEGVVPHRYRTMVDRGMSIAGSVDTVARRLEHVIEKLSIELLVPKIGITLDQFVPTMRPEFDTPRWTEATLGQPMPLLMGGQGPYRN